MRLLPISLMLSSLLLSEACAIAPSSLSGDDGAEEVEEVLEWKCQRTTASRSYEMDIVFSESFPRYKRQLRHRVTSVESGEHIVEAVIPVVRSELFAYSDDEHSFVNFTGSVRLAIVTIGSLGPSRSFQYSVSNTTNRGGRFVQGGPNRASLHRRDNQRLNQSCELLVNIDAMNLHFVQLN